MKTPDTGNPGCARTVRECRLGVLEILGDAAARFALPDADQPKLARDACDKVVGLMNRPANFTDVLRVLVNWTRRGRPRKSRLADPDLDAAECISKGELLGRIFVSLKLCNRKTTPRSLKRRLQLDRAA